ncbi:class I SAM-dependent methyltransferase [Nocardiopsis composta]|uniref:Ubiquinone/menaquinone biosynthesis C-methylase UbiE n=1 Tax=Nocardiopsis composta TaxID=157465 RepID=A0A7W8VGX1_9ACTN|nr:class I SAM-dependent methyltransferase [Nocardiopsis composta]MBB5435580.1 ubiquinone/menaquinone biosynthesis C-methylase UbiE [Nocardiopsis composta]
MPSTTGTAPSGRAPGPAASEQARHRADDILFGERGSRVYALLTPRLLRGVYRRIAEDVADAAPTGGRLLDVGTGPGTMLDAIARYRPDLELRGADPSPGMVAEAGRRLGPLGAGARVLLGSSEELPFPDASFDTVLSTFSLHHWGDPAAAVPELHQVLRPGGRLVVYDVPQAPFRILARTAEDQGLFTGDTARSTLIRTPNPIAPAVVRFVRTATPLD